MCLKTLETEAKIAKKDITVYKVIRRLKGTNAFWEAPVRETTHPFNKILKATDKLDFIYILHPHTLMWTGYQQVKEGFHAYTEPSSQKLYKIRVNGTLLVKAIIPKGSEYVKGYEGFSPDEIVANNMIVFSSNWQYFLWKLGFRKRFK